MFELLLAFRGLICLPWRLSCCLCFEVWSSYPDIWADAQFELSLRFCYLICLPWRFSCRSRFEVWSSTQLSCSVSRSFSSWWRSPLTLAWARRSRTSARRDWRSALNIWSNDAFWCASCSEPIGLMLYKLKTMHLFCNKKSMIHLKKIKLTLTQQEASCVVFCN